MTPTTPKAIAEAVDRASLTDRFTIRMVVVFLGIVALAGLGIAGYLASVGREVPEFIVASSSGALGGLGALLARTSSEG